MTQLIAFSCIFLVLLCLLALIVYRYRQFHEDHTGEVAARLPVDFLIPRRSGEFAEGLKNLARLESEIRQNGFFAARSSNVRACGSFTRNQPAEGDRKSLALHAIQCAISASAFDSFSRCPSSEQHSSTTSSH